jgi:hypothetical protein
MNSFPGSIVLLLLVAGLLAGSNATADAIPPVPADYPSHKMAGNCNQKVLGDRLQHYNETRLQVADVIRHLAQEPKTAEPAKVRLLSYADNFDDMRKRMPAPNPDSPEFQNFDFQLGFALTSMVLFLNTEDEHLAERFFRDRDNPDSELGIYLARLDESRKRYMDHLALTTADDCHG